MSRASRDDEYLTEDEFRAWHGCLQFTDAALRALDASLSAAHGISIKEFDVLITLFNAPDGRLRMTELADRVVLTPSGVSHLVTRLGRAGLVERIVDDDDRRSYFAALDHRRPTALARGAADAQRGGPRAPHAPSHRRPAGDPGRAVGEGPRRLTRAGQETTTVPVIEGWILQWYE